MGIHARGIEHHSKGVENCPGHDQSVSRDRQYRARGRRLHDDHRPGQRPGRPRARPEMRPVAGPAHRSPIPPLASTSRESGASRPTRFPGPGYTRRRDHGGDPSRRDQGALSMCFNPLVSLPEANFTREALEKLEFFGVIDFFLSETAHHADVVFAGSMQEEDEGVVCSAEGRVMKINKAVDPPGRRRGRTAMIICELAKRLGTGQVLRLRVDERDLRRAAARHRKAASRITTASPGSGSSRRWASSGRAPRIDHPGTPRLFEGRADSVMRTARRNFEGRVRPSGRSRRRRISRLSHYRAAS